MLMREARLSMWRFMTFNLRFDSARDGTNRWARRRYLVLEVVRRHRPHLLGTQEGRWVQLAFLRRHLPEYALHAPGRILDDTCQYPTLFVRRDHFRIRAGGEFWLSKTPHRHRSKDWDSAFPRMMSHALLETRTGGQRFRAAVTHLDHAGARARYEQARILAAWCARNSTPLVVLGDFNAAPGSRVHRLLTSAQTGLRDTWEVMERPESTASATHHDFEGIPRKSRIDWILVSSAFEVLGVEIIHDCFEERYPSDHYPYLARVRLKTEAQAAA